MAVDMIRIGALGAVDELVFSSAIDTVFVVLDFLFLRIGSRVSVLKVDIRTTLTFDNNLCKSRVFVSTVDI